MNCTVNTLQICKPTSASIFASSGSIFRFSTMSHLLPIKATTISLGANSFTSLSQFWKYFRFQKEIDAFDTIHVSLLNVVHSTYQIICKYVSSFCNHQNVEILISRRVKKLPWIIGYEELNRSFHTEFSVP